MTDRAEDKTEFFAGVMRAAAQIGWRRASLADIAQETGLSLAELHDTYGGKPAILAAFVGYVDSQVLSGGGDDPAMSEVSARDRLFDVMMRRFETLEPFKDGIAAIAKDAPSAGPMALLCGAARTLKSMAWMLEAAGISSAGFVGRVRAKGLAAVYAATFSVWLRDKSEDMADTMAALDKNLARAERFAGMLDGSRRWGRKDDGADGTVDGDIAPDDSAAAPSQA